MSKLFLLTLPLLALQIRINIITSIIINEVPFTQNLTCIDCVSPVTYEAVGLPEFASIEGNQLQIQGQPQPGQYHLSVKMTDGQGQIAHLLIIMVLVDEVPHNATATPVLSSNNLVVSLKNNHNSNNLTQQLLQSPVVLKNEEEEMQHILEHQAKVNKKIANLLILIRRYRDSKQLNERRAAEIADRLSQRIPVQERLVQEILLDENKLAKDKLAIRQLLEFIKKTRSEIGDKKDQEIQNEELSRTLTETLRQKLIQKENAEVSIRLREQFIKNLTKDSQKQGQCDLSEIEKYNNIMMDFNNREDEIKNNITSTDEELAQQRNKIETLRLELAAAEAQEKQMLLSKSITQQQLYTLELDKNSSLAILQRLKKECSDENTTTQSQENIQKLTELLQNSKKQLNSINTEINDLVEKIQTSTTTLNQLNFDIEFLNRQIDQAIIDLQVLYQDVENLEKRLKQLGEEKNSITKQIQSLQAQLQSLLHLVDNTNNAMIQAKEELGELLVEKRKTDEEVRQIMLNNLDIIKTLKGSGQFKFDFTEIVNMTSSFIDFDISRLYEIPFGEGGEGCSSDITYYGIGIIQGISNNMISMKGTNNQTLELKANDCSVMMVTSKGYEPQTGDVICWKGFRTEQGEWVIIEGLVFLAMQEN